MCVWMCGVCDFSVHMCVVLVVCVWYNSMSLWVWGMWLCGVFIVCVMAVMCVCVLCVYGMCVVVYGVWLCVVCGCGWCVVYVGVWYLVCRYGCVVGYV